MKNNRNNGELTSRIAIEGWYAGKAWGLHRRQRVSKEKPSGFNARLPHVVLPTPKVQTFSKKAIKT